MSRVFRRRAVLHLVIGLVSFLSVIAFTGCTPVPSNVIPTDEPNPDDSSNGDATNTADDAAAPPTSDPADDTTDPSAGDSDPVGNNSQEPVDDNVPPPNTSDPAPGDDADADLTPAENPSDVVDEAPDSPPPSEDPPPTNNNPPAGGTGGNPDPPAENPPAEDPPANDPPAQEPPATDPPAEDPSAEDPPAEDPPSNWPNNAYCAMSANWDANWAAFEAEVVVLVNQRRAAGANCGSAGSFPAANPLSMNPSLQCAARNHSMDMNVRNFFSHTNPDGQGPGYRISLAGYTFSWWGENIAWGYSTPTAVVNGWMNSPGHCANIMNANFTEIGVGYYSGHYWTQTFGRP